MNIISSWEFRFLMHDDSDSSWSSALTSCLTQLTNVLLFLFCMSCERGLLSLLSHCHSPSLTTADRMYRSLITLLVQVISTHITRYEGQCCQVCHGDIRQTVLTPLAPLRDLFSLFQAFPRGGALAASETLDRAQCQIRSDQVTLPTNCLSVWSGQIRSHFLQTVSNQTLCFSNSYTFPCAFTRGSNYYVRPSLVRWEKMF